MQRNYMHWNRPVFTIRSISRTARMKLAPVPILPVLGLPVYMVQARMNRYGCQSHPCHAAKILLCYIEKKFTQPFVFAHGIKHLKMLKYIKNALYDTAVIWHNKL